jgi:hypothetical protein
MLRTRVSAGLMAAALLGVTPSAASAAGGPAAVAVADGVRPTGTPRLATPTVTAADQTVVFEAEVTVPVQVTASGATPTGTVTITEGATVRGSAAVTAGTAAGALPRTLAVGAHSLTASYSGDGSVSPGTSSFVLKVVKAEVSMSIDQKLTYGSPVSVFVTAPAVPDPQFPGTGPNGARPEGTVTLREGDRVLGTEPVGPVTLSMTASNGGVARIDVPARLLPAGVHVLTATYSGSADFNGAEVKQTRTVTKALSRIKAKLRPAQPHRGTPLRLKLKVKTESGQAAKGRVVVKVDGRAVAVDLRDGTASVRLGVLSRGQHIARVVYRGNANVGGSRTQVPIKVP